MLGATTRRWDDLPGLSQNAYQQDTINDSHSQAMQHALMQARAQGVTQYLGPAVETDGPLKGINDHGGYAVEHASNIEPGGTTLEQFRLAQDGLKSSGVTTEETLSPETRQAMEEMLAKSTEKEQNNETGKGLDDARQQAISAPSTPETEHSQSKEDGRR